MSKVKRYFIGANGKMIGCEKGEYVKASDYDTLEARYNELYKLAERMSGIVKAVIKNRTHVTGVLAEAMYLEKLFKDIKEDKR